MKNAANFREPTAAEMRLALRTLALALRKGNAQHIEVQLEPLPVRHDILLDKTKHSLLIRC